MGNIIERLLGAKQVPADSEKVRLFKDLVREVRKKVRHGDTSEDHTRTVYLQSGCVYIKILDTDVRTGLGGYLYIDMIDRHEQGFGTTVPTIIVPREAADVSPRTLGNLQRYEPDFIDTLVKIVGQSAESDGDMYARQLAQAKEEAAARNA